MGQGYFCRLCVCVMSKVRVHQKHDKKTNTHKDKDVDCFPSMKKFGPGLLKCFVIRIMFCLARPL